MKAPTTLSAGAAEPVQRLPRIADVSDVDPGVARELNDGEVELVAVADLVKTLTRRPI